LKSIFAISCSVTKPNSPDVRPGYEKNGSHFIFPVLHASPNEIQQFLTRKERGRNLLALALDNLDGNGSAARLITLPEQRPSSADQGRMQPRAKTILLIESSRR